MPVYLIERALNFLVLKNLDNPIASCTGIELSNLRKLAGEKEEPKRVEVAASNLDYGVAAPILAQPGSVS